MGLRQLWMVLPALDNSLLGLNYSKIVFISKRDITYPGQVVLFNDVSTSVWSLIDLLTFIYARSESGLSVLPSQCRPALS